MQQDPSAIAQLFQAPWEGRAGVGLAWYLVKSPGHTHFTAPQTGAKPSGRKEGKGPSRHVWDIERRPPEPWQSVLLPPGLTLTKLCVLRTDLKLHIRYWRCPPNTSMRVLLITLFYKEATAAKSR